VDLFATSGGAVNALRLVETHPDDVRRLVAHEPPTAALLSDRDRLLAACEDIVTTYRTAGHGPAMAKFIALVMYDGELPADYLDRPAPDPAMFGMSAEDNGSRDDPLMRNFPACQLYEPDVTALRALGDRLVIGVGKASNEEMAARGGRSVAAAVGIRVTEFAGDHGGFLGGEYGQTGEPDAFAADLRAVLA
jgi:pimeloyl-ACP methyl ester carboxylesterase